MCSGPEVTAYIYGGRTKMLNNSEERIELHFHTSYSFREGLIRVEDLFARAVKEHFPAVTLTDTGSAQAFLRAYPLAEKAGIKLIYGADLLCCDEKNGEGPENARPVTVLVKTEAGLNNLYRLLSIKEGERTCVPVMALETYREGLLLGSGGGSGALFTAVSSGSEARADILARFFDYLEIQPLSRYDTGAGEEELRKTVLNIAALAEKYEKPLIASCEPFYWEREDAKAYKVLLTCRDQKTPGMIPDCRFRSTEEMLKEFSFLGAERAFEAVVTAPRTIADSVSGTFRPVPKGAFSVKTDKTAEKIKQKCRVRAAELYGEPLPVSVEKRLEREFGLLREKEAEGIFLLCAELAEDAAANGSPVGNRGTVGSSLIAYLLGLTGLDPMRFHIPEEIFFTRDGRRQGITLDFSDRYQPKAVKKLKELYGEKYVLAAGTITGLLEENAEEYVSRYEAISGETLNKVEKDRITQQLMGIEFREGLKPGGYVLLPRDREPEVFGPVDIRNGIRTTHFDVHELDGIETIDLLQSAPLSVLNALEEVTGTPLHSIPYDDPETMRLFQTADTDGATTFGEPVMREVLLRFPPDSVEDLARLFGLVHGTYSFDSTDRAMAETDGAPLSERIAFRDDVLQKALAKGMDSDSAFRLMKSVMMGFMNTDAEAPREKVGAKRREELEQTMRAYGFEEEYIGEMKKVRYLFPKAHAIETALRDYRLMWYKAHYPSIFTKLAAGL